MTRSIVFPWWSNCRIWPLIDYKNREATTLQIGSLTENPQRWPK